MKVQDNFHSLFSVLQELCTELKPNQLRKMSVAKKNNPTA